MSFFKVLTPDSAPEEVRAQWIRALESGDYPQGKHALRLGGQYCCLGVLCDLAVQAGLGRWEAAETDILRDGEVMLEFVGVNGKTAAIQLPQSVQEWAGLADNMGNFTEVVGYQYPDGTRVHLETLMGANDKAVPFSEIATLIRSRRVQTVDRS